MKSTSFYAVVSSIMAIVAALTTFLVGSTSLLYAPRKPPSPEAEMREILQALQRNLSEEAGRIENVSKRVNAIAKPPPESVIAVQMAKMQADLDGLDNRLKVIEKAVIDNPSKALSIPLLRQELDTLKANGQKDAETQAKQIDRIYDQNKWFIGLMFTMAVGLIGLAISNFIQARKSEDTKSPSEGAAD